MATDPVKELEKTLNKLNNAEIPPKNSKARKPFKFPRVLFGNSGDGYESASETNSIGDIEQDSGKSDSNDLRFKFSVEDLANLDTELGSSGTLLSKSSGSVGPASVDSLRAPRNLIRRKTWTMKRKKAEAKKQLQAHSADSVQETSSLRSSSRLSSSHNSIVSEPGTSSLRASKNDKSSSKLWLSLLDMADRALSPEPLFERSPELNILSTLPDNYFRFLKRVGYAAWLQDTVEDILLWKSSSMTLLALSIASVFCLYPWLILHVPHLLLSVLLISNILKHNSSSSNTNTKNRKKRAKPINSIKSRLPEDLSYKYNMKWIQNTMGMFAAAYDSFSILYQTYFCPDISPDRIQKTLWILVLSWAAIFMSTFYLPLIISKLGLSFNILAIIGLWTSALAGTKFGKKSMDLLRKQIQKEA